MKNRQPTHITRMQIAKRLIEEEKPAMSANLYYYLTYLLDAVDKLEKELRLKELPLICGDKEINRFLALNNNN